MNLYKKLEVEIEVDEITPVVYVGVYVLKWKPEWGEPSVAFVPVDDNIDELNLTVVKFRRALERAEQTIRNLGNGFLTGDGQTIALNESTNIMNVLEETK